MELGKNLEEERESYHFTQKEVADILHVSRQTVSNWGIGSAMVEIFAIFVRVKLVEP